MKYILSLLFLSSCILTAAQGDEWKEPSKESKAYHEVRVRLTIPPYGLAKIKALIKEIEFDSNDESRALDKKTYEALPLREKFTYNMIHAESYSQNCDAMPPAQDEHKRIFGQLPEIFGEYYWSDRQSTFFATHRDSVIAIMKESIDRTKRVGLNFKYVILEIDAREMIPYLVDIYRAGTRKDMDILTVFMLLMKEHEYEPFITSASYRKLYGDTEESYYHSYLNYNKPNEDLIIRRAMDFYNDSMK